MVYGKLNEQPKCLLSVLYFSVLFMWFSCSKSILLCFFPSFALFCYPEPVLECASSAMIVGGHNELSSSGMIADDR
jgi:hypothetical protein